MDKFKFSSFQNLKLNDQTIIIVKFLKDLILMVKLSK